MKTTLKYADIPFFTYIHMYVCAFSLSHTRTFNHTPLLSFSHNHTPLLSLIPFQLHTLTRSHSSLLLSLPLHTFLYIYTGTYCLFFCYDFRIVHNPE